MTSVFSPALAQKERNTGEMKRRRRSRTYWVGLADLAATA